MSCRQVCELAHSGISVTFALQVLSSRLHTSDLSRLTPRYSMRGRIGLGRLKHIHFATQNDDETTSVTISYDWICTSVIEL